MPLEKSKSKAAVGRNIRRELAANPKMPTAQAVAIALDTQRRAGGGTPKPEAHAEPPQTQARTRKRVPARDGLAKKLAGKIAQGGAL